MIITGDIRIRMAQKLSRLSALRLEDKGFKRRGRSVALICREELGLKRMPIHKVICHYEAHIINFARQNELPDPLFTERFGGPEELGKFLEQWS